eukprot:187714-Prorocentrum_minimum.AAC.4
MRSMWSPENGRPCAASSAPRRRKGRICARLPESSRVVWRAGSAAGRCAGKPLSGSRHDPPRP